MSSQTRPDIPLDVCQLGTNFKNSEEQDVKYANEVITHLKHDPAQIIYKQLGKDENLKLVMFASASHGNLPNWESQLGYLTFLVGENIKCSILNWQSKRIKWVDRSSLAAETLAFSDATDDEIYISDSISELVFNGVKHIPIEIYTDSKSLNMMLWNRRKTLQKKDWELILQYWESI